MTAVQRPLRSVPSQLTSNPRVSVVLPVLNEEPCIDDALTRLRGQTWSDLEIIVADGGSGDLTRAIVSRHASEDPRVSLIANPRRLQSAGLNEALAIARGEFIVRVDGHSLVPDDYVERTVEILDRTGASVVGGRMIAMPGRSAIACGVAVANEAVWGAGPARFHRHGKAGPAETVYLGSFRRSVVEVLGGWSEDVGVNEDYELNHRIREAGETVWFDPALGVGYRPRSSLRTLARQYFRYGRSKATVMQRHPGSIRVRQVLPAVLVPAALALAALPLLRRVAGAGLLIHAGLVTAGAARAPEPNASVRAASGIAAFVMHWSWSCGMWFGLLKPFESAGTIAGDIDGQNTTRPPRR